MLTGRDIDIEVNRREVYRYLGYRGREPEEEIKAKIDSCIANVMETSELRCLYEKFSLEFSNEEGEFSIAGVPVKSKDLWKNLEGCEYVYLLGATIGIGIDRLIARASVTDMTGATIYQAVGAAYVEDYVDYINEEIRMTECQAGRGIKPRFSPGYGDLPLDYQETIFTLLNLSKHVGISLTESKLMSPSKSVTAIIGVRADAATRDESIGKPREEQVAAGQPGITKAGHKNCKDCRMKDCPYREE